MRPPRKDARLCWQRYGILPTSANIMEDNLDIIEAVLLDGTTAILYVGQNSTSEGLTEEDAQACVDHFSPYMEWRGMAIKCNFQALTLTEDQDMIRAHEVWSQKTLRG